MKFVDEATIYVKAGVYPIKPWRQDDYYDDRVFTSGSKSAAAVDAALAEGTLWRL